MKKNIIYLTGFMGAGKSTIGPILANVLGLDFYDLDKMIEEKIGTKINNIFEEYGEGFFRNKETEILIELSKAENAIVSLGGGTMIKDHNLKILKGTGKTIYLKASVDSIFKRLEFKRDRPNLKIKANDDLVKEELLNRITELFKSREKFYNQSDIIINTDNVPIGVTVNEIVSVISEKKILED